MPTSNTWTVTINGRWHTTIAGGPLSHACTTAVVAWAREHGGDDIDTLLIERVTTMAQLADQPPGNDDEIFAEAPDVT